MGDGRIERHIKYLVSQHNQVVRIHFNRSEMALSSGPFSQFGERGYRINVISDTMRIKNNPVYFNFFCLTSLIVFKAIKAIRSLGIDTVRPTIFHVHDPALLCLAGILKKSHFADAKIVYDRHEVYETQSFIWGIKMPNIARMYETRTSNNVDGVISVSRSHNTPIHKLFPKAMINTVPNYPCKADYNIKKIINKLENIKNNKIINLSYVGSLANNYDRDIDLILNIYEEAMHSYPNVTCSIGGQCNNQALKNRFIKLKDEFGNRFEYLGRIPRKHTVDLTERSHVGFFLIRPETTYWVRSSPNKVYEYLICGVIPVVRADIDHPEAFANCSLIFERDAPQDVIIRGVVNLLDNPNRLKTMMENSLALSNEFIFESVGINYINIYKNLFEKQ